VEMREVANRVIQVLFTASAMYSRLSVPSEQLCLLPINVGLKKKYELQRFLSHRR